MPNRKKKKKVGWRQNLLQRRSRMSNLLGQRLGDYQLHRLLEQGEIVDSYLGKHIRTGNNTTLKVFRVQVQSADVNQFQQLARRLISFVHPNISRIIDF